MTFKTGLVRIDGALPGVFVTGAEAYLYASALKYMIDQFVLKNTSVDTHVLATCSELYTLLSRSDISHTEFRMSDVRVLTTGEVSK